MRRSKLRSWGLALAVLFGGAVVVRADPPAPPPPGVPLPAVESARTSTLPPVGAPHAITTDLPARSQPATTPSPAPMPSDHAAPAPMPAPSSNSHAADKHGASNSHTADKHGASNSHNGGEHGGAGGHGGNGHGENAHEEEEDHNAIFFGFEYLLLRPRRREQDYALVGSNPNWAPVGQLKSVEGGFDSGGRFGAGYHLCSGYEAIFWYTTWHNAGNDVITQADAARQGQQVFPTLTHPALVTEVTAANAENSINLNVFDVELGKRWKGGEGVTYRAFAGVRYLNMDHKYLALYTGGDVGPGGFDSVRRSLNFNGAGLRAGGEVNYQFWEFFGVYGRGSGSMVVGQFRSQLKEVANNTTVLDVSEKYDKVIPIVEAGVGVSFTRGHFRMTLGYEFWNYFGGFEAIDFADDAHPAKPNRRWADVGFDGLVVRTEFLF